MKRNRVWVVEIYKGKRIDETWGFHTKTQAIEFAKAWKELYRIQNIRIRPYYAEGE